jgi:hypothetical protein
MDTLDLRERKMYPEGPADLMDQVSLRTRNYATVAATYAQIILATAIEVQESRMRFAFCGMISRMHFYDRKRRNKRFSPAQRRVIRRALRQLEIDVRTESERHERMQRAARAVMGSGAL